MLAAANRGSGMNVCFPDVCLTPPPPPGVPVPYVNFGPHSMAMPFSLVVRVSSVPALNLLSKILLTSGDEAGVGGPSIKGQGTFVAGSPNVFIDGQPAVNLTSPTTGNIGNAVVGSHLIASVVNVFYNDARRESPSPDPRGRAVTGDDLLALAEELAQVAPIEASALPGSIGLVRIGVFTPELSTELYNALRRLEESPALPGDGLRALILDLRGNPGGEMRSAIRLAEDFLPKGAVIVRTVDGDGDETVYRSWREVPYAVPLVLLVDGGTASAAELFAGALKAHGRAVVVGQRTYGKGSAQGFARAPGEAGVRYATAARCLLPDGRSVEGTGLSPDVAAQGEAAPEVDLSRDAPLRAAWEAASAVAAPDELNGRARRRAFSSP